MSGFDCFYSQKIDVIELQTSIRSELVRFQQIQDCEFVLDFHLNWIWAKKDVIVENPLELYTEQKANFRFQQQ